jgi:hypothetical protein
MYYAINLAHLLPCCHQEACWEWTTSVPMLTFTPIRDVSCLLSPGWLSRAGPYLDRGSSRVYVLYYVEIHHTVDSHIEDASLAGQFCIV